MVAKPALIRQSDVTRILKGAAAAGIKMSIIVTPGQVSFVPTEATDITAPQSDLEIWKAKREARRKREQS